MRQAQLADGTILEFPDETTDEVMDRTVQEYLQSNQPQEDKVAPGGLTSLVTGQAPERTTGQELARQGGLSGRYLAEGLAGIADLPNAVINAGIIGPGNALADYLGADKSSTVPQLAYPSQAVSAGLDKLGVPQPQNGFERVVGDVSRAVAGAGGTVSGAGALAKFAPALASLAENAVLQGRAAVGSALGAGTTRELGGGPIAQLGAGLAGGGLASLGGGVKPQQTTSNDLRNMANRAYQTAEQKGGILNPSLTNKFIDEAEKVTPQTAAGKLVGGDSASTKVVDRLQALRDKPLSLPEAQELDEFLGDAIDANSELGKVNKQGKKLLDVQSSLRNLIENASPTDITGGREGFDALKQGRQLWSKSAKLGDIERIISRADVSDNPATAIRSGFRTLYNNPNRMKGFSQTERAAIKDAAETGVAGEALRTLASRLLPIASVVSGGGLTGSIASQAGSMAARNMGTRLQIKKASDLANLIATGSLKQSAPDFSWTPRFLGMVQGLNQSKERSKK